MKRLNGEKFTDWFKRNQTVLEQENLELTPQELTRLGMKMFKAQAIDTSLTEAGQKRKLEEDGEKESAPVTSVPKQSKLSAFAFQKKS